MRNRKLTVYIFTLFFFGISSPVLAQPNWTIDLFGKTEKPEEYEERKLPSEKTGEKKFGWFNRFVQNNTTRFNFYFNANEKLKAVISRAKLAQEEDYLSLLSYYPYSSENTKNQSSELDSVIIKATTGILLHDLRSDWVDDMYLLIGKSYFLKGELDSAALTFQFINYNLFPRKKDETDNRVVGTNSDPGKGLSIANPENRNFLDKTFTLPPARNEALIWLIRTYTEQEFYGDAAGMINILQNDRNLPKRLHDDLNMVIGYWFYRQNQLDSAAVYLEKGLEVEETKQDLSRSEYLLAQLFEINAEYDKASSYYKKASRHTTDPVREIYALLSDAKMLRKNGSAEALKNSIAHLQKMARRDRYDGYQDIIYYSAAELSMQLPDTADAIRSYSKSIHYSAENKSYRNLSFLKLAEIAFEQKNYQVAHDFYDSLEIDQIRFPEENITDQLQFIDARKKVLGQLVQFTSAIHLQDSLQDVAAMDPTERDAYLKKLLRKLRKEKGLKETDEYDGGVINPFAIDKNAPLDLFADNDKGEWYFYNTKAKAKGFTEFQSKWGKREDVDNWRRKSASSAGLVPGINVGGDPADPGSMPDPAADNTAKEETQLSLEGLIANLPLNQEQLDSSNAILARNLLGLAVVYQNELEDYPEAILTYENYLNRFPVSFDLDAVYFGLYYCYLKLGDPSTAEHYKKRLTTQYPMSEYSVRLTNPDVLSPNKKSPEVTRRYEDIYELYIEGKFEEAMQAKQAADSIYGSNYWTPQLLYIEAVHLIKERKDSQALVVLTNLQNLYPESELKYKARNLANVLERREQIETYLTNLEVTRKTEDWVVVAEDSVNVAVKPTTPIVKTPTPIMQPDLPNPVIMDTIVQPEILTKGEFSLAMDDEHYVVMLLDKVDNVYINEARNAFNRFNRGQMSTQNITITRDNLDADRVLLLFSRFEDAEKALAYFDRVKKAAPVQVSWLQPAKYSFFIISPDNLELLKENKSLQLYKDLLNANFGNRF